MVAPCFPLSSQHISNGFKKKNTHSFLKALQQIEVLLLLNLLLVWK